MKEASPAKFYLTKFFFLALAFVQWLVATAVLVRFDFNGKVFFASMIFITLGTLFFILYMVISTKMKRVAVGKNKIVIIEGDRNIRFEWPEVKSLQLVPFFNLYKLKLKGKKNTIYFFPSKNVDPAFGLIAKDTSRMGEIVEKRKREFNIK
jgi:hypothetical protein